MLSLPGGFDPLFVQEWPHGWAVALVLPEAKYDADALSCSLLFPEEEALLATLGPARRICFIGGRLALRGALAQWGIAGLPILRTERGGPRLPPAFSGSLSHKSRVAVALAAPFEKGHLGVDVEVDRAARPGIAKFVLTPREREVLPSSPEGERLVTLVFSIKESIYKALDPYVTRYVGFHEVEVLGPEGRIETPKFMLRGQEGPFEADVWWEFRSGYIFSSARIRRLVGNGAHP